MLKITIQVQEKKGTDDCTVKIVDPKDLSKCSESEKTVGAMVKNQVVKALSELEKN